MPGRTCSLLDSTCVGEHLTLMGRCIAPEVRTNKIVLTDKEGLVDGDGDLIELGSNAKQLKLKGVQGATDWGTSGPYKSGGILRIRNYDDVQIGAHIWHYDAWDKYTYIVGWVENKGPEVTPQFVTADVVKPNTDKTLDPPVTYAYIEISDDYTTNIPEDDDVWQGVVAKGPQGEDGPRGLPGEDQNAVVQLVPASTTASGSALLTVTNWDKVKMGSLVWHTHLPEFTFLETWIGSDNNPTTTPPADDASSGLVRLSNAATGDISDVVYQGVATNGLQGPKGDPGVDKNEVVQLVPESTLTTGLQNLAVDNWDEVKIGSLVWHAYLPDFTFLETWIGSDDNPTTDPPAEGASSGLVRLSNAATGDITTADVVYQGVVSNGPQGPKGDEGDDGKDLNTVIRLLLAGEWTQNRRHFEVTNWRDVQIGAHVYSTHVADTWIESWSNQYGHENKPRPNEEDTTGWVLVNKRPGAPLAPWTGEKLFQSVLLATNPFDLPEPLTCAVLKASTAVWCDGYKDGAGNALTFDATVPDPLEVSQITLTNREFSDAHVYTVAHSIDEGVFAEPNSASVQYAPLDTVVPTQKHQYYRQVDASNTPVTGTVPDPQWTVAVLDHKASDEQDPSGSLSYLYACADDQLYKVPDLDMITKEETFVDVPEFKFTGHLFTLHIAHRMTYMADGKKYFLPYKLDKENFSEECLPWLMHPSFKHPKKPTKIEATQYTTLTWAVYKCEFWVAVEEVKPKDRWFITSEMDGLAQAPTNDRLTVFVRTLEEQDTTFTGGYLIFAKPLQKVLPKGSFLQSTNGTYTNGRMEHTTTTLTSASVEVGNIVDAPATVVEQKTCKIEPTMLTLTDNTDGTTKRGRLSMTGFSEVQGVTPSTVFSSVREGDEASHVLLTASEGPTDEEQGVLLSSTGAVVVTDGVSNMTTIENATVTLTDGTNTLVLDPTTVLGGDLGEHIVVVEDEGKMTFTDAGQRDDNFRYLPENRAQVAQRTGTVDFFCFINARAARYVPGCALSSCDKDGILLTGAAQRFADDTRLLDVLTNSNDSQGQYRIPEFDRATCTLRDGARIVSETVAGKARYTLQILYPNSTLTNQTNKKNQIRVLLPGSAGFKWPKVTTDDGVKGVVYVGTEAHGGQTLHHYTMTFEHDVADPTSARNAFTDEEMAAINAATSPEDCHVVILTHANGWKPGGYLQFSQRTLTPFVAEDQIMPRVGDAFNYVDTTEIRAPKMVMESYSALAPAAATFQTRLTIASSDIELSDSGGNAYKVSALGEVPRDVSAATLFAPRSAPTYAETVVSVQDGGRAGVALGSAGTVAVSDGVDRLSLLHGGALRLSTEAVSDLTLSSAEGALTCSDPTHTSTLTPVALTLADPAAPGSDFHTLDRKGDHFKANGTMEAYLSADFDWSSIPGSGPDATDGPGLYLDHTARAVHLSTGSEYHATPTFPTTSLSLTPDKIELVDVDAGKTLTLTAATVLGGGGTDLGPYIAVDGDAMRWTDDPSTCTVRAREIKLEDTTARHLLELAQHADGPRLQLGDQGTMVLATLAQDELVYFNGAGNMLEYKNDGTVKKTSFGAETTIDLFALGGGDLGPNIAVDGDAMRWTALPDEQKEYTTVTPSLTTQRLPRVVYGDTNVYLQACDATAGLLKFHTRILQNGAEVPVSSVSGALPQRECFINEQGFQVQYKVPDLGFEMNVLDARMLDSGPKVQLGSAAQRATLGRDDLEFSDASAGVTVEYRKDATVTKQTVDGTTTVDLFDRAPSFGTFGLFEDSGKQEMSQVDWEGKIRTAPMLTLLSENYADYMAYVPEQYTFAQRTETSLQLHPHHFSMYYNPQILNEAIKAAEADGLVVDPKPPQFYSYIQNTLHYVDPEDEYFQLTTVYNNGAKGKYGNVCLDYSGLRLGTSWKKPPNGDSVFLKPYGFEYWEKNHSTSTPKYDIRWDEVATVVRGVLGGGGGGTQENELLFEDGDVSAELTPDALTLLGAEDAGVTPQAKLTSNMLSVMSANAGGSAVMVSSNATQALLLSDTMSLTSVGGSSTLKVDELKLQGASSEVVLTSSKLELGPTDGNKTQILQNGLTVYKPDESNALYYQLCSILGTHIDLFSSDGRYEPYLSIQTQHLTGPGIAAVNKLKDGGIDLAGGSNVLHMTAKNDDEQKQSEIVLSGMHSGHTNTIKMASRSASTNTTPYLSLTSTYASTHETYLTDNSISTTGSILTGPDDNPTSIIVGLTGNATFNTVTTKSNFAIQDDAFGIVEVDHTALSALKKVVTHGLEAPILLATRTRIETLETQVSTLQTTVATLLARLDALTGHATPFAVQGYYPLYHSSHDAAQASPSLTYHAHYLNGATYYMPDATNLHHGTYTG